jgi:hypothetical protein
VTRFQRFEPAAAAAASCRLSVVCVRSFFFLGIRPKPKLRFSTHRVGVLCSFPNHYRVVEKCIKQRFVRMQFAQLGRNVFLPSYNSLEIDFRPTILI